MLLMSVVVTVSVLVIAAVAPPPPLSPGAEFHLVPSPVLRFYAFSATHVGALSPGGCVTEI